MRGAHPRSWYQLTTLSDPGPLTAAADGVLARLSPSQVESFHRCGLRWLLDTAAGAGSSDVVRHFGVLIHAAAVLAATGADGPHIEERIDDIWHHLDFGSPWFSEKERERARVMVSKFLAWHKENPRDLVAVEQPLRAQIGAVEIRGQVDRLEKDAQGRAVVVDLKTGSTPVPSADLDRHAQLGVYQLAVLLGAFERYGLIEPGGAELVQVGNASLSARVRVQPQRALPDDPDPGMGQGTGRDRGRGHGRAVVPGQGEPGVPHLSGEVLLPGAPRRRAGDPVSALDQQPGLRGTARAGPDQVQPRPPGAPARPARAHRRTGGGDQCAPMEPLSVIAGAGSGKSETMAARLVWLVANGMVRPERVLGLTFTRKAAGELGQRVRARLAGPAPGGARRPACERPRGGPAGAGTG